MNQKIYSELTPFSPPPWLCNKHLQTILPNFLSDARQNELNLTRQVLKLDDGDALELLWNNRSEPKPGEPITLLLHGLGGSEKSHYVKRMLMTFMKHNQHAALLLFRDCGTKPNHLSKSYHAGETGDLDFVANTLAQKYPDNPLHLLGYSLGANVLLKYLGERRQSIGRTIKRAAAVSVPFQLTNSSSSLNRNWIGRTYQQIFLRSLRKKLVRKFKKPGYHTPPTQFNLSSALHAKTLWQYDELCTAPLHGFQSAQDYYNLSSCRQYLIDISIPTLILHSADDPLLTTSAIPNVGELAYKVQLEKFQHGGHVGFVTTKAATGTGKGFLDKFRFVFWADLRLLQWFGNS